MKIGILGSGMVGQALGRGFVEVGHDVKMGTRNPNNEKVQEWVKRSGKNASAGTFAEAAEFSDIAVLCTLWSGTQDVIRLIDPKNLAGKVVIDTTNPLVFTPNESPTLAVGLTTSAGEIIQKWLPQSYVVKAFNIVGSPHMFKPQFSHGQPDMFICGNNAPSKVKVTEILTSFGWNTIDIGGIDGSRYLEPLAMIWIACYFKWGTGNHAFKLLQK